MARRPDFHVGVLAGPHGDEVPPCPVIPGHDDAGFGGVGQHRASGLTRLLAAQNRVRLIGELGFQLGQQLGVGGAAGVGGRSQDLLQFGVVLHAGRHDDLRVFFRHVALRQLRVGEMPVPDQLVGAGSRDAGDVERHTRVLEHRKVPDVDDVLDVAGVGRGPGIGLGPALIAGPAGELDERGPPSASVVHGTSGGARNSVLAISCTRSGAVSATALTLARTASRRTGGVEPARRVPTRRDPDLARHQQWQQRVA